MTADKTAPAPTPPENQQYWWVQEFGVSVEARTHAEAVEKAKKLAKENK